LPDLPGSALAGALTAAAIVMPAISAIKERVHIFFFSVSGVMNLD
jgi:hypothetical protein